VFKIEVFVDKTNGIQSGHSSYFNPLRGSSPNPCIPKYAGCVIRMQFIICNSLLPSNIFMYQIIRKASCISSEGFHRIPVVHVLATTTTTTHSTGMPFGTSWENDD
jgi:hypothetical protein